MAFKIFFQPRVCDEPQPAVSIAGDVLTIDGEDFDFSPMPEGGEIGSEHVASDWIIGVNVCRIDGEIRISMPLPIGPDAPEASRFPAPVIVNSDGPVTLPAYSAEEEA